MVVGSIAKSGAVARRKPALSLALCAAALATCMLAGAASAQSTETYTYDALGRISMVVQSTGKQVIYSYDAAGNRTQVATTVATTPSAANVSASTWYNTAVSIALSPSGGYQTTAVASQPSHGSASISGTTATYTPTSGYSGADSFTYTATGPGGTSAPATVSVTVQPPAPTVGNLTLLVSYNTAKGGTLTPSGNYTSLAIASAPAHGTGSISGTTTTYTPNTNYSGADSFTYTATGPGGTSAPGTVSETIASQALSTPSLSSTIYNWRMQDPNPAILGAAVTATPNGGFTPYTYAWQYVSGNTTITATAPTSASTQWVISPLPADNADIQAVWRCKVTDASGAVVYSANVNLDFQRYPTGPQN